MEVHAHTHTPRKKWTHYFWEFLMLFLAVFCGFLAENQREHMVEHQREKQYITSFISNLSDDTASIKQIITLSEYKIYYLEVLLALRYKDFSTHENLELFYRQCFPGFSNNMSFISNDATMTQLRNSGGLRLIRKKGAADSIAIYQQRLAMCDLQKKAQDKYFTKTTDLLHKLIDETILSDTTYYKKGVFTSNAILEITNDKLFLREFFNCVNTYKFIVIAYVDYVLKPTLGYAERLISFLNKTYTIN